MNRRRTVFTRAVAAATLSLALGVVSAPGAAAGVSIHFSSGYSGHSHGHRPRYSHGVPFIKRRHLGHGRHHRPHRFGSHLHRRHLHGHAHRGAHVLSSGCSPATQSYRDRHGHLVIHHVSVCHDRYGRRYVLGGPAPRH